MTRSRQVSPVPEIGTPGLKWRGLETAYGEPKRARSWKRRIQPRGAYGALRQSSTLLKTAKALGLTIPQSLLLRADELIRRAPTCRRRRAPNDSVIEGRRCQRTCCPRRLSQAGPVLAPSDPRNWGRMGTRNRSRGPSSAVWRRELSAKYAEGRAGEAMNPLPLPVAKRPRVFTRPAAKIGR